MAYQSDWSISTCVYTEIASEIFSLTVVWDND